MRYNYAKKIVMEELAIKVIKAEENKKKNTNEVLRPKDIVDWGE